MRRLNEVKEIYDFIAKKVTSSQEEWKAFLRFSRKIYRYDFNNAIMIYVQRLDATLEANM